MRGPAETARVAVAFLRLLIPLFAKVCGPVLGVPSFLGLLISVVAAGEAVDREWSSCPVEAAWSDPRLVGLMESVEVSGWVLFVLVVSEEVW